MSNIYLKKGHLLIAEPSIIGDLSFNRSIIIIADHNTEGSIGFILNKPLDFTLQDLIPGQILSSFYLFFLLDIASNTAN